MPEPVNGPIVVNAPAKVNLALRVGHRREDGDHGVDTVMLTLGLSDVLTADFHEDGARLVRRPDPGFPESEDLCMRAAVALADAFGREPAVLLHLDKEIPVAAGLGGGSADAAAVLVACCSLWGVDPGSPRVEEVAASLGADVPFMLRGGCAWLSGRGDVLVAELDVPELDVVLVNPGVGVATADVYAAFDWLCSPTKADLDAVVHALATGDRTRIAASLTNDLTEAAFEVAPRIAEAFAFVRDQPGTLGTLVAGSGGTVFGITESASSATDTALAAAERGWWSEATIAAQPRPGVGG